MTKPTRPSATDDARPLAREVAQALIHELADLFGKAAKHTAPEKPDIIAEAIRNPKNVTRFWAKVARGKPNECWLWQGWRNAHGYGVLVAGRKQVLAHRYAWVLAHGTIPPGMGILHSCDNRGCTNVRHLRPGTHADNARDRVIRRRTSSGERHHACKLTVTDVRSVLASTESSTTLAARYGVSRTAIERIRKGETWKHLHPS
jgi:hypothetical protein